MPTLGGQAEGPLVGLAPWHVARSRLADPASTPLLFVEAGGGYGKTSLVREAAVRAGETLVEVAFQPADRTARDGARRLAAAVRDSPLPTAPRLADLDVDEPDDLLGAAVDSVAAALPDGPVRLLLDDVHHLGAPAAAAVARGATDAFAAGVSVSVAGRSLAPSWSRLSWARAGAGRAASEVPIRLGPAELAFDEQELAAVLRDGWDASLDPVALAALRATSAGWPAAVVLAAPQLAAADTQRAAEVAARSATVPRLLADLLEPLDDEDLAALAQVARVPRCGPALDRALGRPSLFERSRSLGLPYEPTEGGWWTLPDAVREPLALWAPLDPAALRRVANEYTRRGQPIAGVTALVDAGVPDAAADLLAALPAHVADAFDLAELVALIERLPARDVDRRPELLVHLARACIPAVAIQRREAALARAAALAAPDSVLARAVTAEQALDLVRDGRADEAVALAQTLLATAGSDEVVTRCRAFDVVGRALAWQADNDRDLAAAAEHLRTAAGLAEIADVAGIAAEVYLALGYAVEYPLGRLDAALAAIDQALSQVPGRLRRRATIQTFRADVLHGLGRDADATAALADAAALAHVLGDDRIAAYAAWEAAKGASRRGEREATLALLDEVLRHRGPWFEHPTGMVFLADAAECCERVGDATGSRAHLLRAEAMMRELLDDDDLSVWLARAGCAARSGDPVEALAALDTVDRLPGLAPKDRWRPLALRAVALARSGQRAGAAAVARAALDAATALGAGTLPAIMEPTLAPLLTELAGEATELPATLARVEVLGGLRARVGETPCIIPPGLPGTLVKLLALHGGRLHQEVATELMWPDGDLAGASQRLRNVLHRLRDTGLVRRDGEHLILAPGTQIDLVEFETLAARAVAAGPGSGTAPARVAASLYTGPLLPDDPFADWAIAPRERARRAYLDVLDLLAADALARDDSDDAVEALTRALAADPDGEQRAVALAQLYADGGRTGDAVRVLQHAAAALADLGLTPSESHRRLLADLTG